MTAAIHVCDSEGKWPDHVAGRFGSDALETLARSTIGRRSPRRCRPSPRSLVECGLLGVIHVLSRIAGSALADISGAVFRSASVYSLCLVPGPRIEPAACPRRSAIAEGRVQPPHSDWKPGGSDP